jgi:pectin-derived oligosaccharide transport system substrate-binding protein
MLTRRDFIRSSAMLSAGAALAACSGVAGGGSGGGGKTKLNLSWWGGSDRNKRTNEVIKLYEKKHGKTSFAPQPTTWQNYWQKMDTDAAGGGLPDVLQMDMAYIGQYTKRSQIMDLAKYKSTLDLGDSDSSQMKQGTVSGKLVGVSLGGNIPACPYNASVTQNAGLQPAEGLTWEQFPGYLSKLKKTLPSGMYASDDGSGVVPGLEVWVRQRGTELWTADGKLAFSKSTFSEWMEYWADMRKSGLLVPGKVDVTAAQIGTPDASPLVKRQAAFTFTWSNFLGQYQILMKDKVGMMRFPQGGGKAGDYVKASQLFSISDSSKHSSDGADFISFFLHNSAAIKVLGVERGVPASAKAREIVKPTLKDYDAAQVDFFDKYSSMTRAKTVLDPTGAGDVGTALTNATQAVALGKSSVNDAVDKFWSDATKALAS